MKEIREGLEKAISKKIQRKFKQSVEMIVNFKGVDFKKNRFSINMILPKGRGKPNKIVVVADEATVYKLKNTGIQLDYLLKPEEVNSIDIKRIKRIAKRAIFYVMPQFIPNVAKVWGKILGSRGNTIMPLIGDPVKTVESAKNMIRYSSRGKFLPTVQFTIGTEDMSLDDLYENAMAIIEEIDKKKLRSNIRSIYFKLSMSPPVKVRIGDVS
ncbi:MAG: hypothetical protein NZ908_02080 [Candidatus Micrarchaeota archaeon]|nr:hypothetical protein [Candidatus Micrarchaeota archaeon]MCX8154317.1 hypothetical protein [Candidatus Micrarchaeota archaeon]